MPKAKTQNLDLVEKSSRDNHREDYEPIKYDARVRWPADSGRGIDAGEWTGVVYSDTRDDALTLVRRAAHGDGITGRDVDVDVREARS